MLELWTPRRNVVVTVVYDPNHKAFFLAHNPRWGGYSLPTRPLPKDLDPSDAMFRKLCEAEALQGFRRDSGLVPGPHAAAEWMDHLDIERRSGRTGRLALYTYDIVTVDPQVPLPPGTFSSRAGLLSYAQILESEVVTWTTREILAKLLGDQHVGLGLISRRAAVGREYLMIRNRYGKFFFPAARQRRQGSAAVAIVMELREKYRFLGHVEPQQQANPVEIRQSTPHLGPRTYWFHLVKLGLSQVDLFILEEALVRADVAYRWVTDGDLGSLPGDLSDTVSGVRNAVCELAD